MIDSQTATAIWDAGYATSTLHKSLARDIPWRGALNGQMAFEAVMTAIDRGSFPSRETRVQLRDAITFSGPAAAPTPALSALHLLLRVYNAPTRMFEQLADPQIEPGQILSDYKNPIGAAMATRAYILDHIEAPHDRLLFLTWIAADIAFARSIGLRHMTPLLTLAPPQGANPDIGAVAAALCTATNRVSQTCRRLEDAWQALQAIAPRLRSRQAASAIELFGKHAILSPRQIATRLTINEAAARRLCERMRSLGGLPERSGRDQWKIYGL